MQFKLATRLRVSKLRENKYVRAETVASLVAGVGKCKYGLTYRHPFDAPSPSRFVPNPLSEHFRLQ
jgi:hypothetical protein